MTTQNTIPHPAAAEEERFTLFPAGYRNQKGEAVLSVRPQQDATLAEVYHYITGTQAREATAELRRLVAEGATDDQVRDYKKLHFAVACFMGTFSYRNARSLLVRSPFIVADIDHLQSTSEARQLIEALCADRRYEVLLAFVSPKGRGCKAVFRLPPRLVGLDYKEQFERLRHHLICEYAIPIDQSGSDVSRACFLPHDPECYFKLKEYTTVTTYLSTRRTLRTLRCSEMICNGQRGREAS